MVAFAQAKFYPLKMLVFIDIEEKKLGIFLDYFKHKLISINKEWWNWLYRFRDFSSMESSETDTLDLENSKSPFQTDSHAGKQPLNKNTPNL